MVPKTGESIIYIYIHTHIFPITKTCGEGEWVSEIKCDHLSFPKNPGNLRCNLKIEFWKMIFVSNWAIFSFQILIFRGA